jgi:hypothetical protein
MISKITIPYKKHNHLNFKDLFASNIRKLERLEAGLWQGGLLGKSNFDTCQLNALLDRN